MRDACSRPGPGARGVRNAERHVTMVGRGRLADVLPREVVTGDVLSAASWGLGLEGPARAWLCPLGLAWAGVACQGHGGKGECGFVVFLGSFTKV